VKELASKMAMLATDLMRRLIAMGIMASINQDLDADTAALVASELGFEVVQKAPELSLEEKFEQEFEEPDDPTLTRTRPPVVTVMGHVDHGKTSLLDAIRHTNVTAREAGGITQHIGASVVEHKGKRIVFLDTPGHEAFTTMRARGAKVTDIAVLVVAADDGVMPQTIEALNHARAAKVPVVVAINKMDRPNARPDRVRQQLAEHGLVAEEWGGETIFVPVSATARTGIEQLLEMILLVAEVGDLKADPNRKARGTVIEAQLDKGRGPIATVLIHTGTLKVGDAFVTGTTSGRVRDMTDAWGRRVKRAGPSMPVEVGGMAEVPQAGDNFLVIEAGRLAKDIAENRQIEKRQRELATTRRLTLDDLFTRVKEGDVSELNLVIKADVQGSVEAVRQALEKLSQGEVRPRMIHSGVGAITESDIMLAAASNAIVIGFNVRPDANARRVAEDEKVDTRTYRIIYEAIQDIEAALKGLLKPKWKEVVAGRAEVRAIFRIPKVGVIAGCYVTEGKIDRAASIRLIRNGVVINEGKLSSLKRFKDDVREVTSGFECGIGIEKFQDIKEGDVLEAFTTEEVKSA
jgi:translation initiation factor IF-2